MPDLKARTGDFVPGSGPRFPNRVWVRPQEFGTGGNRSAHHTSHDASWGDQKLPTGDPRLGYAYASKPAGRKFSRSGASPSAISTPVPSLLDRLGVNFNPPNNGDRGHGINHGSLIDRLSDKQDAEGSDIELDMSEEAYSAPQMSVVNMMDGGSPASALSAFSRGQATSDKEPLTSVEIGYRPEVVHNDHSFHNLRTNGNADDVIHHRDKSVPNLFPPLTIHPASANRPATSDLTSPSSSTTAVGSSLRSEVNGDNDIIDSALTTPVIEYQYTGKDQSKHSRSPSNNQTSQCRDILCPVVMQNSKLREGYSGENVQPEDVTERIQYVLTDEKCREFIARARAVRDQLQLLGQKTEAVGGNGLTLQKELYGGTRGAGIDVNATQNNGVASVNLGPSRTSGLESLPATPWTRAASKELGEATPPSVTSIRVSPKEPGEITPPGVSVSPSKPNKELPKAPRAMLARAESLSAISKRISSSVLAEPSAWKGKAKADDHDHLKQKGPRRSRTDSLISSRQGDYPVSPILARPHPDDHLRAASMRPAKARSPTPPGRLSLSNSRMPPQHDLSPERHPLGSSGDHRSKRHRDSHERTRRYSPSPDRRRRPHPSLSPLRRREHSKQDFSSEMRASRSPTSHSSKRRKNSSSPDRRLHRIPSPSSPRTSISSRSGRVYSPPRQYRARRSESPGWRPPRDGPHPVRGQNRGHSQSRRGHMRSPDPMTCTETPILYHTSPPRSPLQIPPAVTDYVQTDRQMDKSSPVEAAIYNPCRHVPGLWFMKIGLDCADILECSFDVDKEIAERWNFSDGNMNIRSTSKSRLKLQLLCLPVDLFTPVFEALGAHSTPGDVAIAISQIKTEWPTQGCLVVEVNPKTTWGKTWLPSHLAPESPPLDITTSVSEGTNLVRLIQLKGMAEYMFILHATALPLDPQDADLSELASYLLPHTLALNFRPIQNGDFNVEAATVTVVKQHSDLPSPI